LSPLKDHTFQVKDKKNHKSNGHHK
jgi:hypothetical protein